MRKPCASSGCPELVERGESYCAEHAPPAWGGRSGNLMPRGWAKTRRRILSRDRYECRYPITDTGLICGARANEVDHIIPRSEGGTEDLENLRAICHDHHHRKTQEEARRARAAR